MGATECSMIPIQQAKPTNPLHVTRFGLARLNQILSCKVLSVSNNAAIIECMDPFSAEFYFVALHGFVGAPVTALCVSRSNIKISHRSATF